jgi:hypothetical protein
LPDGWYILIPKIPFLVYFWRPWNGNFGYTIWPFWYFYGCLLYFFAIRYDLLSLCTCFPILVCYAEKHLATPSRIIFSSRSFPIYILWRFKTFSVRCLTFYNTGPRGRSNFEYDSSKVKLDLCC